MSLSLSSEPYRVYVNTVCGQNVEFVSVKPGGTCNNDCTLKGSTLGTEYVRNIECCAVHTDQLHELLFAAWMHY